MNVVQGESEGEEGLGGETKAADEGGVDRGGLGVRGGCGELADAEAGKGDADGDEETGKADGEGILRLVDEGDEDALGVEQTEERLQKKARRDGHHVAVIAQRERRHKVHHRATQHTT